MQLVIAAVGRCGTSPPFATEGYIAACYCRDSEPDQDGAPAGRHVLLPGPDIRREDGPASRWCGTQGHDTNCLGIACALPVLLGFPDPSRASAEAGRVSLALASVSAKAQVWAYARSSVADDDDDWMGHARVLILLPTVQPRLHFRV